MTPQKLGEKNHCNETSGGQMKWDTRIELLSETGEWVDNG